MLTSNSLILLYSVTVWGICLCPSFELGSGNQAVCVYLVFILPPCVCVLSFIFFLLFSLTICMKSCSHRKWRENSCIRHRGENHLHECQSSFEQNKQAKWSHPVTNRFSHLSQVLREGWVGGVDLSLCIFVLNPCCKVGRKMGKGKASRCFIMFRTAVSFSGWLKHLHGRVTTAWAIWGWAGPRGVCARCTPGLCDEGLHNPGQTFYPSEERGEAAVVRAVWIAVSWRQARPSLLIPCCPQTQSDSQPGTAGRLALGFTSGDDAMGWVWQNLLLQLSLQPLLCFFFCPERDWLGFLQMSLF